MSQLVNSGSGRSVRFQIVRATASAWAMTSEMPSIQLLRRVRVARIGEPRGSRGHPDRSSANGSSSRRRGRAGSAPINPAAADDASAGLTPGTTPQAGRSRSSDRNPGHIAGGNVDPMRGLAGRTRDTAPCSARRPRRCCPVPASACARRQATIGGSAPGRSECAGGFNQRPECRASRTARATRSRATGRRACRGAAQR